MSAARVRVRTGSRLHFGLIDPTGRSGRLFGGVGVMVEAPELLLEARAESEADVCECDDREIAARVASFRDAWRAGTGAHGDHPPVALRVVACPHQHLGLGTGTQLGLSAALALSALVGERPPGTALARAVGRGKRSAIGVHGFDSGGLIVDGGHASVPRGPVAPLVARHPVPESWRFVLVASSRHRGLSGASEARSFRALPEPEPGSVEALARLALFGLCPTLAEGDADAFGDALWEFGCRAGEPFRDAQSGLFASARIAAIVDWLRAAGLRGVGQSSWGPTVFALVADPERAARVAIDVRERFALSPGEVVVTPARNRGAELLASAPRGETPKRRP